MKCPLYAVENEAIDKAYESLDLKKTNDNVIWEKDTAKERMQSADKLWATEPIQAFQEFQALAEQGSVWSMNIVGHAYCSGRGVKVDLVKAEEWYRRAIDAGSDGALLRLNIVYGITGDVTKAEKINQAAIAKDFTPAMCVLARIYLKHLRTREALDKAQILLERAISLGDLTAKRVYANNLVRGRFGLIRIPKGIRLMRDVIKDALALEQDLKRKAV